MIEREYWKPISNYEGLYKVSNLGRVRSLDRYVGNRWKSKRLIKGTILKPGFNSDNHSIVWLSKLGITTGYRVHVLVLIAFKGPRPKGLESCHRDDIKTNNRITNLYYGTRKQNAEDAVRNRKMEFGEKRYNSKLTDDNVRYIKENCVVGSREFGQSALARKFGVDQGLIWAVLNGFAWKHVS